MKKPLFFPETLQEQLLDLQDSCQLYTKDEKLIEYLAGINYIDPSNPAYTLPEYVKAQMNILDWYGTLEHYFSEPSLALHPNFSTYVLHWEFIPIDKTLIPLPVTEILDMPHNGSKVSSYTTIGRGTQLMTWVDANATIEQCLETLDEWQRISNWVSKEYEGELDADEESIWDIMGIGGDDSVDYQSSYLDSVIQFFRAYLYLQTKDERFIK